MALENSHPTSAAEPANPPKSPEKGRPRVLDPLQQSTICTLVSAGFSLRAAAKLVGCAASTINYLARRDEDFARRLREARMECELAPMQNLKAASARSWRAAAWFLERRYPTRYMKTFTSRQVDELLRLKVAAALRKADADRHDRLAQEIFDQRFGRKPK
jgi:hypothetical protein